MARPIWEGRASRSYIVLNHLIIGDCQRLAWDLVGPMPMPGAREEFGRRPGRKVGTIVRAYEYGLDMVEFYGSGLSILAAL